MRSPSDLSREELIEIISEVQFLLWWDWTAAPDGKWNANREWDGETLYYVAAALEQRDLCPYDDSPDEQPIIAYRQL